MKLLRNTLLGIGMLLIVYSIGYVVSAHRFVGYSGSAPIYDPNWSMTVDLHPHYRFFTPHFWTPIHSIDRRLRPDYWTFIMRADSYPSEIVVGWGAPQS